ncbi:MAG: AAA family ATPase [Planctomycetes bacterium]|nr:AAA family ATPase [Planctomycetota bacterium]
MTESRLSTRRQLELMQQLQQSADERAALEDSIATRLREKLASAEKEHDSAAQELIQRFTQQRRATENEYAEAKSSANQHFHQASKECREACGRKDNEIEAAFQKSALAIEQKKKESVWQTLAVFDAAKDGPQQRCDAAIKRLNARRSQIEGLERDANTLMAMRRLTGKAEACEEDVADGGSSEASEGLAEEKLQESLNGLHQAVLDLQSQRLPSLFLEGTRPVGWWIFSFVFAALPMGWLTDWSPWQWSLAVLIAGATIGGVIHFFIGGRARRQALAHFSQLLATLKQTRSYEQAARDEAQTCCRREAEEIASTKDCDVEEAEGIRDLAMVEIESGRDESIRQIQAALRLEIEALERERDAKLTTADERFPPLLDKLANERNTTKEKNEERYKQRVTKAQAKHDAAWAAMSKKWHSSFQAIVDELEQMGTACKRLFPNWSETNWADWDRPTEPPPAITFGSYQLPLAAVKHGVSEDPRLVPKQTKLTLPAVMTLDELPGLVISAEEAGRSAAVEVMQSMMLRFLTAMPAGKLRFTIIDPSALGENFATFMHLADYDEQLVGGRIWTDTRQIDERLSLLADHMEKVLQKYLRNEFNTLHQYNQQAGEVSEPYHVLVVANFPAGLSDASIRKLMTIATTGPRCGVYTILSHDTQLQLPNEFSLQDLYADAVHLEWVEGRLVWRYPLFEKLPLKPDPLPLRDRLNELLRVLAQESREASKVEVPFSVVAPSEEQLWASDAASELVVPVGRAGANDLQSVRLGRGTSQHVLIAGKTGSGKSTLLHALITNAALHYSPDEVELYLVDFKKGVEFKAYANGQLPHARVIAIESEREFGVSVLERLDEELRRRGERFRDLGVQDLAGCRAACDDRMPRVLLIVDEFQELFVTDDKLSQDAALLLDRLVRQGRAFGIHVLLGSQTLAGAYSLARSTIGQMAVRIALECSDADAHLILSDENTAARLLSRPGEAIYNNQNGMVEGNNTFQVVWLPDEERQQYLETLRVRAESQGFSVEPAIVFEGNLPADPRDNPGLVAAIENAGAEPASEPTIWLGSAVRIEPPTHVTLRAQGGNHLLVVGREEQLALGILSTALVSLVAQHNGRQASFTVLDGTRPESTEQGAWTRLGAALPKSVEVLGPREAASAIAQLADEVTRRSKNADQQYSPHYLIVHDLAQFRDLRITEDDFGFSSSLGSNGTNGQPVPTDKQFRTLLREGPAVGVHVLLWCESFNSLSRTIDRLTLRELDYRVALQMSSVDSTSLIDSPAASRLGEHRAVLYRDDLGTQVKFRPYGRPTTEWIDWVAEQLANNADLSPRLP